MALVLFLRGVNVGGRRTFRPRTLAANLKHLGAVSIGAAGTFVIQEPVSRAALRAEVARRLPFVEVMAFCPGRDVLRLVGVDPFSRYRVGTDVVPFVSVLSRPARLFPPLPLTMPSRGRWLLKVLERDDRFVIGVYRRDMRVIGYLGALDRLFGAPVTTRSWATMATVASVLGQRPVNRRASGAAAR